MTDPNLGDVVYASRRGALDSCVRRAGFSPNNESPNFRKTYFATAHM